MIYYFLFSLLFNFILLFFVIKLTNDSGKQQTQMDQFNFRLNKIEKIYFPEIHPKTEHQEVKSTPSLVEAGDKFDEIFKNQSREEIEKWIGDEGITPHWVTPVKNKEKEYKSY